MPPCIIRSPQTQVNTRSECCDVGIRCVDLLPQQKAQGSIVIAIFEVTSNRP